MTRALYDAFELSATLRPENTAFVFEGRSTSYSESLAIASGMADHLRESARYAAVIALGRSPEAVLWQLAASKAGQTFVPMDPRWPMARICSGASRMGARWIVASPDADFESAGYAKARESGLWTLWSRPGGRVHPEPLSHAFFSSGSTGEPKAILLPGSPIAEVVKAQARILGIDASSHCAWLLSPGFDASLSDIYSCLLSGGTLYPYPAEASKIKTLKAFLADNAITHADLPPSLLTAIDPQSLPAITDIVFGGELAPLPAIRAWLAAGKRLFNAYGPTEATICSHMAPVDASWEPNMAGAPLPGVAELIHHEGSWRIPKPGMRGELGLCGPHLALGYADEELTRTRFVHAEGIRVFMTGDLFEYDARGRARFLGRLDRQFKRNGALACPEEIEARALSLGCSQARAERSGRRLVLSYAGPMEPQALLAALAEVLPAHLLPNAAERFESLQLGSTGKTA
jgi:non-ribosomal peptide synthetase component F